MTELEKLLAENWYIGTSVVNGGGTFTKNDKLARICRELLKGINLCIEDNLHLADGDNCTLIDLKRALKSANEIAKE